MATYTQKFNFAKRNVNTTVIMCTPTMANGFLAKNPNNRKVNKKNVQDLVNHIINGDWEMNGEAIIIDKDGSRDVHCVYKNKPLFDTTILETFFNIRCDVYKSPTSRNLKP